MGFTEAKEVMRMGVEAVHFKKRKVKRYKLGSRIGQRMMGIVVLPHETYRKKGRW